MTREKWLRWRMGGIGSSDLAGVLGLSPWATPFSVWWSKVRDLSDEEDETPVQRRGQLLERAVVEWAAGELGSPLVKGSPVVHPEHPWARVTPDAWTGVDEGLEGKTCRVFDELDGWGEPGTDQVPLHYRIQCLWCLEVTGAHVWRLAAFATLQEDWRIYEIQPDPEVGRRLLEEAGRFWQDHVVANVPPALDTTRAANAYLLERFPAAGDQVLEATAEDLELLERYEEARFAEKAAAELKDGLAVKLKERIGDAGALQGGPGELRATWSRFDRSSVDLDRFRAEHPDLAELLKTYTRTTPSSRLTVSRRTTR